MLPLLIAGGLFTAGLTASIKDDTKKTNAKAQEIYDSAIEEFNKEKERTEQMGPWVKRAFSELDEQQRLAYESLVEFADVAAKAAIKFGGKKGSNVKQHKTQEAPGSVQFGIEDDCADFDLDEFGTAIKDAASTAAVLAMSGSLATMGGAASVVGTSLSLAGTVASIGEIGGAVSILGGVAGTAASTIFAPAAAVALPIMLFSSANSSIKADENLEEAKKVRAQCREQVEKMKTEQTLCENNKRKARMFSELLRELRRYLDAVTGRVKEICAVQTGYSRKELEDLRTVMYLGEKIGKALTTVRTAPVVKDRELVARNEKALKEYMESERMCLLRELNASGITV